MTRMFPYDAAAADRMLDFILQREGGFVNDPKDPGGATKYGISLRFLKTIDPAMADLDEDGDVDVDDIFALSPDLARAFYRQWFYQPMRIDQYPAPLGAAMLDTGVNMGMSRAGRILQSALNQCGAALVVDGIVGVKTRTALMFFDSMDILRAFLLGRIFVYAKLCRENQDLHRFFFGWVERVRHLESFCLDLDQKRMGS
jgi:lysozyme family protein